MVKMGFRFQAAFLTLALSSADAWILPQARNHGSSASLTKLDASSSSVQNIVLSPSDDPSAFDSLKIGTACVHRYSREEDPEGGTEYVMWYHGRSKELDDQFDNKLPPLSTGRIGRATSRNGLVWEKDTVGSISAAADIEGVSMGLNKEEWWGFDTTHVGLGSVMLPMTTPAVINEGGVYIMYFMGGDHGESSIADLVDGDLPDSMKDATITGIQMKIGVAISQDGIAFGKVEGDDPSGACLAPYRKDDPNVEHSKLPRGLQEELYVGWPDVVVNPDAPAPEAFMMFYSCMIKDTKEKCIALAVSEEGFRWEKKGVVLKPDADGLDATGCARSAVVQNAEYNTETGKWKSVNGFTMYYDGSSKEDKKHRIMQAESSDGKKWTKVGVVLDVGEPDGWDHGGVSSPHIIRLDDGTQRMYYTGQGVDDSTAIGVAKMSIESGVWEREVATFKFA
mmetsp:Transcript_2159/g.2994  ORF Transcript_2159/g.2994 Transcript_2159/m.2994 type:complete len:451 (-) Transcript_2159:167-1519(-)